MPVCSQAFSWALVSRPEDLPWGLALCSADLPLWSGVESVLLIKLSWVRGLNRLQLGRLRIRDLTLFLFTIEIAIFSNPTLAKARLSVDYSLNLSLSP